MKKEEASPKAEMGKKSLPSPPLNYDVKETTTLPTMVARHLTKQGGKKKTNIEVNTKTQLRIVGDFDSNEGGTVELEISGEVSYATASWCNCTCLTGRFVLSAELQEDQRRHGVCHKVQGGVQEEPREVRSELG